MGRPLQYQEEPFEPVEWTWTVRRNQRLLRPDAACIDSLMGVIGRCQHLHGQEEFRIYYATIESTQIQLVCAVRDPQVGRAVKQHLATNMAKEIQALRGLERGGIWARPCRAIPIKSDIDDRLKHLLALGYSSSLVSQITQWPGLGMLKAVLHGEALVGTWYNREGYGHEFWKWDLRRQAVLNKKLKGQAVNLAAIEATRPTLKSFATEYPVTLSTPPSMAGLSESNQREAWLRLIAGAELEHAPALREDGTKWPIQGLARVLKMSPKRTPKTPPVRPLVPWIHGTKAQTNAWLARYEAFVLTFRGCMARLTKVGKSAMGRAFPWGGCVPPELAKLRAPAPRLEFENSRAA